MDETARHRLQQVINNYRTLSKQFHQLHALALQNGRLEEQELNPIFTTLTLQEQAIEAARDYWWMFYSEVDDHNIRVCGLPDDWITVSYQRNLQLADNLQGELLAYLAVTLTGVQIADLMVRSFAALDLAKNLAAGLIADQELE